MSSADLLTTPARPAALANVVERDEDGLLVLGPARGRPVRRVLYVNSYGGRDVWQKVKSGELPGHHLWGCLELAASGYEIALAEPLPDFYWRRRPLPHDLRDWRLVQSWLGPDGIVFCGHNVLYWLPLLRRLGLHRARVVSLLFAREPLDHASGHTAIVALTPAAEVHARQIAPRVPVAHLGWGADLAAYPPIAYRPEVAMSCGIANRDFRTLSAAAGLCRSRVTVITPGPVGGVDWPAHVELVDGGKGWNCDDKKLRFDTLVRRHYPRAFASLVILKRDDTEYTANGFTNLIEGMALARPVIVTRTGALPGELDVEAAGCGLFVPPEDPAALAAAIDRLGSDLAAARRMGERGRQLCESHYNIRRFAADLHALLQGL